MGSSTLRSSGARAHSSGDGPQPVTAAGARTEDGRSEYLLECARLTKSFGEVRAVDGIDLAVRPGERLGIIGPNGSGKTTLFNCLSGFHTVTSGVVWWRGVDVTSWRPQHRARHGLVRTFQHVSIFGDLTVSEAVRRAALCRNAIGKKERLEAGTLDAERVLEQCNLARFADRQVAELAYGTQKLVNVAMAVATQPVLLMLDEPAAGLSAEEASELGAVLSLVADLGMTVCLVDHNMPFLSSFCLRVVVLDAGAVLFEGTPQDVRQNPDVRRVYLGGR